MTPDQIFLTVNMIKQAIDPYGEKQKIYNPRAVFRHIYYLHIEFKSMDTGLKGAIWSYGEKTFDRVHLKIWGFELFSVESGNVDA